MENSRKFKKFRPKKNCVLPRHFQKFYEFFLKMVVILQEYIFHVTFRIISQAPYPHRTSCCCCCCCCAVGLLLRAPRAVAEVEALLGEVEHLIVRAREVKTVHNAQVKAGVVATLANIYSFI
jgi:hypothetical protein